MTIDTSEVHWFWLGVVRCTGYLTAAMAAFLLFPITIIAMAGGYLTIERLERTPHEFDRFAVWSWRKVMGGEK